jgi:hypothetical protein
MEEAEQFASLLGGIALTHQIWVRGIRSESYEFPGKNCEA